MGGQHLGRAKKSLLPEEDVPIDRISGVLGIAGVCLPRQGRCFLDFFFLFALSSGVSCWFRYIPARVCFGSGRLVLLKCSFTPNSPYTLHYTYPTLPYYPSLPYPTMLYLTLPYHLTLLFTTLFIVSSVFCSVA